MANTRFGNVSRNDYVCFADELAGTPPVDLADINASGGAASRILAITSGGTALEWIPQTGSASALASLSDCTITSPTDGALLIYDVGTSKWRDATVSGAITITDAGVTTLQDGIVDVNHLANGAGQLGTRLIGLQQTAANGAEAANEIEVSIGFVDLNGDAIDFTTGWSGIVPSARVIVSPVLTGPKRHTSAYVSSVTQGTVVDGLNTAECVILGTEPATGTHIKFKVKYTSAGSVYIWLGSPDCSYFSIFQYTTGPVEAVFA